MKSVTKTQINKAKKIVFKKYRSNIALRNIVKMKSEIARQT